MTFILAENRKGTPREIEASFERYRRYLLDHRDSFPPSAFELAVSDWYFSLNDPRAPHDAWLESLSMVEEDVGPDGKRGVSMRVRLLNAQHDRYLVFSYPHVSMYQLELTNGAHGHRDWRYDEFRVQDDGKIIHEIEWAGPRDSGRWMIVASDAILTYSLISEADEAFA